MGSLRLRGKTWWCRYYHTGKLIEESTGTNDERKARGILRAKVKAADTPQYVAPHARRMTFDELAELVRMDYRRKHNKSARKLDEQLAHLSEHFGGWQALAITSDHIDRYADDRIAQGAQPSTLNRELSALRRAFRLAVQKGMLPSAPHVTLRPEDNIRQGFLDVGALDAFLIELRQRDPVASEVAETAFCTLLRRSNVLALTWPMFSLEVERGRVVGGELRLPGTQTKNKRPLALPLSGRFLDLVNRRWAARLHTCAHVFHRAGVRVTRFDAAWKDAASAAGHPGLLLHDLRRSGARALIRAGVPEDVVMKLGGWRTRSMLTRYNIVSAADLADAQERLTAAFEMAPRMVTPLRRVSLLKSGRSLSMNCP
jgi:integrase